MKVLTSFIFKECRPPCHVKTSSVASDQATLRQRRLASVRDSNTSISAVGLTIPWPRYLLDTRTQIAGAVDKKTDKSSPYYDQRGSSIIKYSV